MGFSTVLNDPLPRATEGALARLTRIADGMDRIVGDTTDAAARAAIVTEAARVAARPPDDATAVVAHGSFGIFDLPVLETRQVEASDSRVILLAVLRGAWGMPIRPSMERFCGWGRQAPRLRKRDRHLSAAAGAAGAKRRVPLSLALPAGSQGIDLKP
ncbi:hypothetical protein [Rhodovulum visakhapatnamense]|uniref:hypothetical protein n=1 Tax=Rhodovulum visakhapatnamense TaxID=364297 RepID=UPI00106552C6|nr:hypothetical protein [Rhodovulum visakhapatnamense]